MITYSEVLIIDTKANIESEFYGNEFEINNKNNLESEVIYNKLLLPDFYSTKHHFWEDIANILEFNIMCFNLPANPVSTIINQRFLANATNCKRGNI